MPQAIKQHPLKPDTFLIEKATDVWTEYQKTKPDLSVLHQSTSRPIAVLGAGASLPDDIKNLPIDCLTISCNHHALRLVPNADYIAFLDPVNSNHSQEYKDVIRSTKIHRISVWNLDYTDYYCVSEEPWHDASDTGRFATWLACYITSGDVILCGMNLRLQGERNHFYDSEDDVNHWGGSKIEVKLAQWKQVFTRCYRPERVKAMSGILVNTFGQWKSEKL